MTIHVRNILPAIVMLGGILLERLLETFASSSLNFYIKGMSYIVLYFLKKKSELLNWIDFVILGQAYL